VPRVHASAEAPGTGGLSGDAASAASTPAAVSTASIPAPVPAKRAEPAGSAGSAGAGRGKGGAPAAAPPVALRDSGPHAGYPRVTAVSRRLVNRFVERLDEAAGDYDEEARREIVAAARWANARHSGQFRASGDPFIIHPLEVAAILVETRMDTATVVAALLHDVVEDTPSTLEELTDTFGKEVANLVEGVTKISIIKGQSHWTRAAESIRKMLFAMVRDVRVILIKLADKVHNMRTLEALNEDNRTRIARECMDIYCPLAGRLGLYRIRTELEDLAMKYLHPRVYDHLKEFVAATRAERDALLKEITEQITVAAQARNLHLRVESRAKHFFSIYQKMKERGHAPDEIYDLLGVRIVCSSTHECYEILGLVHQLWMPIEGRFKDYIAMPKSNRYQSLHTTVMGPGGTTIEIQIRSSEMHETAENGIAAHWLYKSRRRGDTATVTRDLSIINKLRDLQGAQAASTDFLSEIKRELLRDSIYVFTPKGDIIELPRGSTPIDFAYHIHTEVGNRCMAAKANGSIVALSAELKNTQVIQIITSARARPHVGWLRTVKTSRARQKIRHWLTLENPDLIIQRNIVAQPARPPQPSRPRPAPRAETEPGPDVDDAAWRVGLAEGNDAGLLIQLARCCRPKPSDEIVGYVSRGRGIIVHRSRCANARNIRDFTERAVEVAWETPDPRQTYSFTVTAEPDARLYSEIERIIHKDGGKLLSGNLEENAEANLTGRFTVEVNNRRDFGRVVKHLKSLDAVRSLHRLN
jgi:GTP pyrophosphokinase